MKAKIQNMIKTYCGVLARISLAFAMVIQTASAQTTVRIHGAVTPGKILQAQKDVIETKTGVKLEIVGNGSSRGLADLADGAADIAMVGSSLKATAAVANKEKPGSIDTSGLTEIPVSKVTLLFVTHPGAGVKSLTTGQTKDILSGKIKNWKDVGGNDVPIKVVLPFVGDGSRTSIQEEILGGADFTKDALLRNLSKDITPIVVQMPGACSALSAKNVEGSNVAVVKTETELFMPLVLVVKGEPGAEIKKVIEEAKSILK